MSETTESNQEFGENEIQDFHEPEVFELSNLFTSSNPTELKARIEAYSKKVEDSEQDMENLINEVWSRDKEIRGADFKKNYPKKEFKHQEDIDIKALYNKIITNKRQTSFLAFLKGHFTTVLGNFINNYTKFMSDEKERVEAEEDKKNKEQEEEKEKETLENLKLKIKDSIIKDRKAECANIKFEYSREDQLKLIEAKKKHVNNAVTKEISELEFLFVEILEKEKLFGKECKVYHSSEFDDYVNHVDFIVDLGSNLPLIYIDITCNQSEFGAKLLNSCKKPFKKLGYPTDYSLRERFGVPIVLGMTLEDMRKTCDMFLEESVKDKFNIEHRDDLAKSETDLSKWINYVQKQILFLNQHLSENISASDNNEEKRKCNEVIKSYNTSLRYLGEIKKEGRSQEEYSSSKNRPKNNWDWLLNHPDLAVKPYLEAANNPHPILPLL